MNGMPRAIRHYLSTSGVNECWMGCHSLQICMHLEKLNDRLS